MARILLSILLLLLISQTALSQTFRLQRPVSDEIQTNGSYLFAEPAVSSSSSSAHQGIDMDAVYDSVYAAHSGTIGHVENEDNGSCGIYIAIDDYWEEEKLSTIYCHLSEVFVEEGETVESGQPIAISGNTGNSTGPHLHFEVQLGRHSSDPGLARSKKNPELWVAIEGMGAIYGRVPNAVYSSKVEISPYPKPVPPYDTYGWSLTYKMSETYIGSDPVYRENYAIGDVVPGEYTITALDGEYVREVVVEAGQVVNADANYTSIEDEPVIASEIQLHQNYPNPFNPSSTINYSIPEHSFVDLAVFNAMGKKVAQLVNDTKQAGSHEVIFDGSHFSSGIYFYRLKSNQNVITKRMSLIK